MRLRPVLVNTLVVMVSVVVALVLAEIATRIVAPQYVSGSWLAYGPRGVLMNKAGGGPVRNEMPDHSVVYYEFNNWHQRGRADPDPAAARVLVLGDSFTFGLGVPFDDTYVERLQKRFDARGDRPRVQLLNAATGGWGTADQLTYLEGFGDALALSGVVVFVNFGDFSRATNIGLYQITPDRQDVTPVDQSARRSRTKLMLEGSGFYNFLLEHSHLLQLARVASLWGLAPAQRMAPAPRAEKDEQADRELGRLLFRRLAAWCKARDVQLTVVTTGSPGAHFPWLDPMLRADGIYFRDLYNPVTAAMGGKPLAFQIPGDGHPNAEGARVIADAAWPVLDERLRNLPVRPFKGR